MVSATDEHRTRSYFVVEVDKSLSISPLSQDGESQGIPDVSVCCRREEERGYSIPRLLLSHGGDRGSYLE